MMARNTCGDCEVGPKQEAASSVAGNIGTLCAKVEIWENDPFYARPHQTTTFPFSNLVPEQLPDDTPGLEWLMNSAFLKPIYQPQDMFICSYNPNIEKEFVNPTADEFTFKGKARNLDFVGSLDSMTGKIAGPRLPGGIVYETQYTRLATGIGDFAASVAGLTDLRFVPNSGKDVFPHQVWMHVGSIFKRGVALHPSEYAKPLDEIIATRSVDVAIAAAAEESISLATPFCEGFTDEEIHGAVKWDYVKHTEEGTDTVWPYQITKQAPGRGVPVHWTLEKFTPVYQGQDFFVTIETKKETDESPDVLLENEFIGSCVEDYKYLMYDNTVQPAEWINGISNSAFFVAADKEADGTVTTESVDKAKDAARKQYWWKYKSYILIEIGTGHPDHNYFIELVKGRNPRLLHLGYIWDNPKRRIGGEIEPKEDELNWHFMKQCRMLGEFGSVSCNELFKQDSFRLSVRNHIGRLIITFEGYEGSPWVIQRRDNEPHQFDFRKTLIPMVVPSSKLRIHGGNLSCVVNYSPLQYTKTETVYFRDRQADTSKAGNNDLWMTFSHMGGSQLYQNPARVKRIFSDPRLNNKQGKFSYDIDAYIAGEIHRNKKEDVNLYRIFRRQYTEWGKGWVLDVDRDADGEPKRDPDTGLISEKGLKSGFNGGTPHSLRIDNAKQPGQEFQFGLRGQSNANYPYKEYASKWDVQIKFNAGTVLLPVAESKATSGAFDSAEDPSIIIDDRAKQYLMVDSVTPIATSWRLIVLGGEKPTRKSSGTPKIKPFDIAPLTTKITDGWTSEGWHTIRHEAKVQCYIPLDTAIGDNKELYRLGKRVKDLHNKAFYVTISYWWADGIGERDAIANKIKRKNPDENDLLIQMTGIAYGGTLSRSVNKIFFDFDVKDYMSVLEKQFIFNSPFFDGVADAEAVYELARLAGFDDEDKTSSRINRQPLGFLQHVIKFNRRNADGKFVYNGETVRSPTYDLPGSYATLQQPAVRFQNGETYEDAFTKIAQLSTKVIYFDRWGVLRLESVPAIEAAFFAKGDDVEKFESVFDFVTSPFPVKARDPGDGSVSTRKFQFDPCKHGSHLVYDVVQYNRSVEDCINQIVVFTASNDILLPSGERVDGGFIVEGYTFFDQIWNPEEEGFLGFRKPFYQSNGVFGGIQGVRRGLQHYAKMKYPIATVQFSTYGIPGLKALDIITLDDNLFYITEINHDLDPSTNRWWMNITGEWLKPFLGDLGFLEERDGPADQATKETEEP